MKTIADLATAGVLSSLLCMFSAAAEVMDPGCIQHNPQAPQGRDGNKGGFR